MDIVFVHGWASGFFVWRNVSDQFPDHNCHVLNLGFIGEEKIDIPEGDFLGVGHSLGGLWLLKHYPERMKGFVSISSFHNFFDYVPEEVLKKMQDNINSDIKKQLDDFWGAAGWDHPAGIKKTNPAKLIEGLKWLAQWDCDVPENLPVKVLAAKDDQIVSPAMAKKNWDGFDINWTEKGGHMLPDTKPEWCVKHIKDFINEL